MTTRLRHRRARAFDLTRALVGTNTQPWERLALGQPFTGSTGIVYDGAKRDRFTSDWRGSSGSADSDLVPSLATLRERSRELVRNNPIAASIVRVMVDNIIGTGIRVQARVAAEEVGLSPEAAAAWNARAERLFLQWSRHCDLHDHCDFFGIQSLICERWIVDGEIINVPVQVERIGRSWLTAMQVIECDRLQDPLDSSVPLDRLRSGVELDANDAPAAFWIARTHPGDRFAPATKVIVDRVPAWTEDGIRRVQHVMLARRSAQSRGEPFLAPIMEDLRHLGQYDEAELIAARIAACHTVWRKQELPDFTLETPDQTTSAGDPVTEIEPGLVVDLAPGEDVTFGNPSRPSSNYEAFIKAKLRICGAPYGLPLELVLSDWSETSWTSGRMSLIEARRSFRRMQRTVIGRVLQGMYELVIEEAVRDGRLEAPTFDAQREAWLQSSWIPPGSTWVDPVKEVQASKMAVELCVSTLAEECAAQGRVFEEVAEQRAREIALLKKLGLPTGTEQKQASNGAATDDRSDDADEGRERAER